MVGRSDPSEHLKEITAQWLILLTAVPDRNIFCYLNNLGGEVGG